MSIWKRRYYVHSCNASEQELSFSSYSSLPALATSTNPTLVKNRWKSICIEYLSSIGSCFSTRHTLFLYCITIFRFSTIAVWEITSPILVALAADYFGLPSGKIGFKQLSFCFFLFFKYQYFVFFFSSMFYLSTLLSWILVLKFILMFIWRLFSSYFIPWGPIVDIGSVPGVKSCIKFKKNVILSEN